MIAAFCGCVASNQGAGKGPPKPEVPVGYRYLPKNPPGLESLEAVRQDLAVLLASPQNPGIKYFGQPGINTAAGEADLIALVKGKSGSFTTWYDANNELLFMAFDSLTVLEDRIEVCPQIAFWFADLIDRAFVVEKTAEWPSWGRHIAGKNMVGLVRPYKIAFPGLISFVFEDLANAQRFADDLFFIQQGLQQKQDQRRALFESRAAQYRDMKIKPAMSEEQRRYLVQASVLAQRKDYPGAINLCLKAVDLDPVSAPGAYLNLALFSAQMNRFSQAIAYMKQYLRLEPEEKDARSAQDKIYEWELMVK